MTEPCTNRTLTPQLVLASHNKGKLVEIRELLKPYGLDVIDAATAGVDEPEETGISFIENAELKARHSAQHTGLCALADDSGLVVNGLDGMPGIYSARWAGAQKDFSAAMQKVEKALIEKGQTPSGAGAYFACALSLSWPDGHCISLLGKVHGTLQFPPRGLHGFGYDPIFVAQGKTITFGEMDPQEKHAISHRADAFLQLISQLAKQGLLAQKLDRKSGDTACA
jgi:XTP/dITP diphosphohydrolase